MKQLQQLIREFSTPNDVKGEVSYKGKKVFVKADCFSWNGRAFVYYYGDSLENFVKNFVNEGENVIPQEVKDVEWTDMNGFCILKPEFTQYKSDWFSKLNADGWQIIKHKDFQMTPKTAAELYEPHKDEDFYNDLVKYMSSGPCCCVMCKKNTKKPIDAMNVLKDEIRAEWGIDKMKNAMHSSDSLRNVEREANIIFNIKT